MRVDSPRPYVVKALDAALKPKSVAIVGASRTPGKVGYEALRGLLKWGYRGAIYPVNPRATEVQGLKAYRSLLEIPDQVDLVFVAVPAYLVRTILGQSVKKQVGIVALTCSGLKETGRGDLQDQLTAYCREHELPFLGPNLVGLGNPHADFNCGFVPYVPMKGSIGFVSQSGANLLAGLGASIVNGLGLSFFAGLGNKADVDFSEFISYAGADEKTSCIAAYIEGLDSPEAFIEACRSVVPAKPVVVLKAGGSRIGAKAAFAHTASENKGTSEEYFDELFEKAGAVRVTVWQELMDSALALGVQPPLAGDNVVMITNGGGSGLLCCDHFERVGMPMRELAGFAPELTDKIRAAIRGGSLLNPVDIGGTASAREYKASFRQAFRDPRVDGVLGSISPTAITDVGEVVDVAIETHEMYKDLRKPFIMELQGGFDCAQGIERLKAHGIPAYPTAEQAVNAMVALRKYGQIRERLGVR